MAGDRGVQIGRATQHVAPPIDPTTVNVVKEVAAIREMLRTLASEHEKKILRTLASEHDKKIGHALDDAEEEASKQAGADRSELGNALDRALRFARSASGFAKTAAKLIPHVSNAVAWLGDNGPRC